MSDIVSTVSLSSIPAKLDDLQQAIEHCLTRDRHVLRKRLQHLQTANRKNHAPESKAIMRLHDDIQASIARCEARAVQCPALSYPAELPVSEHRDEIINILRDNQVVIIAGETGSGKTTQLPKLCLAAGRGISGLIGHTQPRRIAARSVAARIAEELNTELGATVGYKVRFSDRTQPDAYIKLMTDGILLAELQQDHYLSQYDTLIIDEAHERSLNIDFLLGYLKRLLPRRHDLKLIITSATIDTERFSRHFSHAPVIEVSGRTYPVEMRYRPLVDPEDDSDAEDKDVISGILAAVDELAEIDRWGDILIFLNGERDIRDTAEALRKHHPPNTEILPLYSRLSTAEQNRVFQTGQGQRIILATNVAETSLTVPGIRFVIDPGSARISRYSYRSKVQRLPVEKISQSSANQRAGRCGRVSNGICIRLYSEEDFLARPEYTEPEIQRTNLASVILQMLHLELGNPGEFPFIDAPDSRYVNDGYRLLQELGALDDHKHLTTLGGELAKFPVDPRIARMVLEARELGCLKEILIIASALSVQDPRERPMERQQQADEKHVQFADDESDFMALLKLWAHFQDRQKHLSRNQLRKHCQQNFLSLMRLQEWQSTYQQLRTLVKGMSMKENEQEANYTQIHQSLLPGLLGNIGMRMEVEKQAKSSQRNNKSSAVYQGPRNMQFCLFPGSSLVKSSPRWVMAAEMMETSRLFARYLARIEPEWIEHAAKLLVKRSYTEPHWNSRQGAVTAFETVNLYGLTIHARRPVHFGPIDPQLSREIFIREALVQGQLKTSAAFMQHNQQVIAEAENIEDKIRRRDIVASEAWLFDFFAQQLPADIYTANAFDRWYRRAEQADPDVLKLTRSQVIAIDRLAGDKDYPSELSVDNVVIPLAYCFDPGGEADGVSATVPLGAINQLDPRSFDWLVPGFLLEKITLLLKGLPKSLRRQLVPVPEHAEKILMILQTENKFSKGDLLEELQNILQKHYRLTVNRKDWRLDELPIHLNMRFLIVDHQQKTVASGRNLQMLKQQLSLQTRQEVQQLNNHQDWPEPGISEWNFGELPENVEIVRGGSRYQAYPALVDKGDSVGIEVFDARHKASSAHKCGLIKLVMLLLHKEVKYLLRHLPGVDTLCLQYTSLGSCDSLKNDLLFTAFAQTFFSAGYEVRNSAAFEARIHDNKAKLNQKAGQLCHLAGRILESHHRLRAGNWKKQNLFTRDFIDDIEHQLTGLIFAGFIRLTPAAFLEHIPRFLSAIEKRLEKYLQQPAADTQKQLALMPYLQSYDRLCDRLEQGNDEMIMLRWMLEEFRVSLFAQNLGTAMPVSTKRLDMQIQVCENQIRS